MAEGACYRKWDEYGPLFFGPENIDNPKKEKGRWERIRKAKAICQTCPVEMSCLTWALVWLPKGNAGGMTERERERLKRFLETVVVMDS